jgi:ATP-dependent DNA helicase 2 subunit 2
MAEVIASINYPRVKAVRPVHSYKGLLTLGDPESGNCLAIDVERYPRTKRATPASASKYVPPQDAAREPVPEGQEGIQGGSVALQRTYMIKKGGEEKEVEKEDLDKAYLYGRTIVPFSDADLDSNKFATEAELGIIGFIKKEEVQPHSTSSSPFFFCLWWGDIDCSSNGTWL